MKQPTLKQACESLLQVECPLEYGYDDNNLFNIYMAEYGNYRGFTQPAVTEYTKGLPSCFTFPIYNGDILEAIAATGYPMEKHREATKDKIIDLYWQHIGYAVFKHLKQVKKKGGLICEY